jgi:hypothetical protein
LRQAAPLTTTTTKPNPSKTKEKRLPRSGKEKGAKMAALPQGKKNEK